MMALYRFTVCDLRESFSDRRGRRSEHARARVLPQPKSRVAATLL